MSKTAAIFNQLEDVLRATKTKGADAAEIILAQGTSLSASVRLGEVESITESAGQTLGIRAFVGGKVATQTLPSLDPAAIDRAASFVVAAAKTATTVNPHAGLAAPHEIARSWQDADIYDAYQPPLEKLIELAKEAEDVARQNPGVSNSQGGSAGHSENTVYILTSNGFAGSYSKSGNGMSVTVIAEAGGRMERDGEGTSAVYFSDLQSPAEIGREAARKTVAKLNARKPHSAQLPVIFDPDMAAGLLRNFASAVSGRNVRLKQTFLLESRGKLILPPNVTIIDDPALIRGLGSKPFDAEGLATAKLTLAENGVLKNWLLDLESARALNLAPQGNAGGGPGANPSPTTTNLYMLPGNISPEDLMADIRQGFYVTNLMSQGVNILNGDYARAASGFWIENGKIAYPVSQVTIAGNLGDMFKNLTPADDVDALRMRRGAATAPTLRIEGMMLSGK